MKFHIETERLVLRELLPGDEAAFFEMDSNPEVHRYLGNHPVTNIEQIRNAIASIRQQYVDHGIGRWAVMEKSSGNFIGWSGLKFITEPKNNQVQFYDVGFRLNQTYWGKGYATETTKAALEYGFKTLQIKEIIGICHEENRASRRILEKCGLNFVEKFKWDDLTCHWLKITKEEWD